MASKHGTFGLAGDVMCIARKLLASSKECHYKETGTEISTIANELAGLSATIWQLQNAIDADPAQYSNTFNDDLQEILAELKLILAEIDDCCAGLRLANPNSSLVARFFRKGRVTRLLQHLEALKGTLVVMRTVLQYGKECGKHRSHLMCEERVILDSLVTQNRDTISNLHSMMERVDSSEYKPKTPEREPMAGGCYSQLPETTEANTQSFPDVLLEPIGSIENRSSTPILVDPFEAFCRTFSKRGARLGVHMSMLDLNAHEAPDSLKEKWILQTGQQRRPIHEDSHPNFHRPESLIQFPGFSATSRPSGGRNALLTSEPKEATGTPSSSEPRNTASLAQSKMMTQSAPESFHTAIQTPNEDVEGRPESPTERLSSPEVRDEKIINKLRRIASKLSILNLRSPSKVHE